MVLAGKLKSLKKMEMFIGFFLIGLGAILNSLNPKFKGINDANVNKATNILLSVIICCTGFMIITLSYFLKK